MALALRRGVVASVEHGTARSPAELVVAVEGERRLAVAYRDLTGEVEAGDDVVVNTAARDLGLGSGGFDVVHVNLTRGLGGRVNPAARTMKLNYTSLQHGVATLEAVGRQAGAEASSGQAGAEADGRQADGEGEVLPTRLDGRPVAVLALHGQLEPVAWAAARRRPGMRIGYLQTGGGALPGGLSHAVRELRGRGLLADHVTVAPAFGGEHEAMSVPGALASGFGALGWDAAILGPGPGIVGSGSALGHGGLAALDSAHASLALGARTLVVPRMSSGDPRRRHRGLSHHTTTVLNLLLRPALVALPRAASPALAGDALAGGERATLGPGTLARHDLRVADADLEGYRASGLSVATMGRSIDKEELFFGAALAGGAVLAELTDRGVVEERDV
jgi:hypothetical protein